MLVKVAVVESLAINAPTNTACEASGGTHPAGIVVTAGHPDKILHNGKLLTVDTEFSIAEAIAISEGRITAVGSNAEILSLSGPETAHIDLEGRTVIPGLIDNHMHYMRGASRWRFEARIDGITSRKEALKIIGQKVIEAEPGQWVFVLGGWSEQQFADAPGGFTTEELDTIAPVNPLFMQKSYSRAYMNSLAQQELAEAGDSNSREGGRQTNSQGSSNRSQGGRSQSGRNSSGRNSSGRSSSGRSSSGRSGGARAIINQATTFIPHRSADQRVEDVAFFNTILNSHGLTTVYDVGRSTDGNFDPVKKLADQGKLTLRTFHSLRYRADNPVEVNEAITLIQSSKPRLNNDWFGLIGIGEHTYNPLHDSSMRVSLYDDDVWNQFQKIALYAAEGGWHIHEHAMQDSTASRILDIAEIINENHSMKDLRWTIAHCDLISKESIARAKKLGLTIAILNKTNKVLNNAMAKNWKLCGHNIKGFDVPCLGKRMVFNGINPSGNIQIWDKKPWEIPYVDTSDIFAFGSWVQQKYLSLDLLACSLNIPSPKGDLDGSKVNHTYWIEKDYDKISTYCEADVKTVMDVMEKVCF